MAEYVQRRWVGTFDGPSRIARKPCFYKAYVPDLLTNRQITLTEEIATTVSDAVRAILHLNSLGPALTSLEAIARLRSRPATQNTPIGADHNRIDAETIDQTKHSSGYRSD